MEVTIPCADFARARFFYSRVLCLPVGKEGEHHAFFDTGGSLRLALVDARQSHRLTQPSGRGAFLNLSCDDLAALRIRLGQAKIRIEREVADQYGRNIVVRDPEGTTLCIYEEGSFDAPTGADPGGGR